MRVWLWCGTLPLSIIQLDDTYCRVEEFQQLGREWNVKLKSLRLKYYNNHTALIDTGGIIDASIILLDIVKVKLSRSQNHDEQIRHLRHRCWNLQHSMHRVRMPWRPMSRQSSRLGDGLFYTVIIVTTTCHSNGGYQPHHCNDIYHSQHRTHSDTQSAVGH